MKLEKGTSRQVWHDAHELALMRKVGHFCHCGHCCSFTGSLTSVIAKYGFSISRTPCSRSRK